MTDNTAKKLLRRMLRSFTAGRVLHLLAHLHVEAAKEARQNGNELLYMQLALIEAGLIVAGYGVDAAWPDQEYAVLFAERKTQPNHTRRNHVRKASN